MIELTPDEFHRRRAEAEMDRALGASKLSVAMLHLELARQHRETCLSLAADRRLRPLPDAAPVVSRTDKES